MATTPVHVIALIALLLRLCSRWYLNKKYGVDDWIMAAVAAIYVAFQVIGGYIDMLGFGIDIWYVEPDNLTLALKVSTFLAL